MPTPLITKATVVGSGAMATVAAQILASNGVQVSLLARDQDRAAEMLVARENRRYLPGVRLADRVHPTANASRALGQTELIVASVPCQFLRTAWMSVAEWIAPNTPVCSVIKGIEVASLARPSRIIAELSPKCPTAVLSGPSVAPELARCLPATVVVASANSAVAELIQTCFSTSWFRVYTSPDVIGVELAGALKNVIALAAGILDGLHAGDNAKAALVTRGLVEITRLGVAMGARPETFSGLAGVGDLLTTCVSPHGRNRTAGERIGSGVPVDEVVASAGHVIEGIPTCRAVLQLARDHRVEMPITQAVHDVLFGDKAPLVAITELMNRPPRSEA